ncbi:glutathione ABC transporter permease GsiD [Burkholderia aenigmatica]|uniref:Glutathione ABC transporter permease GsiD n=2 Tax=Burkholderia TaxID=32008 RepID=A0A6J5IUM9_9BURK|nr:MULTISPECIES: ABC transporter permease [Burkholderia]CAB3961502.1 glutathione ABC transporter permease GsiD [Burkholderia aenigmatica]
MTRHSSLLAGLASIEPLVDPDVMLAGVPRAGSACSAQAPDPAHPVRPARGRPLDAQIRTGAWLTLAVMLLAFAGPFVAPHAPTALPGTIYGEPARGAWLGYDYLGHDVLSRVLAGGRTLIAMTLATSVLALVLGTVGGVIAGYRRGAAEHAASAFADALLAFPSLILTLLVVSMLGRAPWLITLTVALALLPGVLRLARSLTAAAADEPYVEVARMLGYSTPRILAIEILPNIAAPLLVHFGNMLTWAISLIAALGFLGYGVAPPAADWGLMVNENRAGLQVQPWAVLAPMAMIVLFAIGTNLLAEGWARALARDTEV